MSEGSILRPIIRILAGVVIVSAGICSQAIASDGFDPRLPCGATLRGADDTDKALIAAWVFGYLASSAQDPGLVHDDNIRTLLNNLYKACARDEQRSLVALVQKSKSGDAATPGSKKNALAYLNQFLDPNTDHVALTAQMAPTAADIAAVYGEPLASKLTETYAQMFVPGARIGPKPGQNEVILVRATTASLKRRDAVISDFPGGYADVLPYFTGDHPIVRFKFVTKGEKIGNAFDGLI